MMLVLMVRMIMMMIVVMMMTKMVVMMMMMTMINTLKVTQIAVVNFESLVLHVNSEMIKINSYQDE